MMRNKGGCYYTVQKTHESSTQIFVNPLWPKHTELTIPNRDRSLNDMQEKSPLRDKTEEPERRATP